jgi:hypothetical protein
MHEKPSKTRLDWRLPVVFLLICSTLLSLFAASPISADIMRGFIRGLSAYRGEDRESKIDLSKHLATIDENGKIRHFQKIGDLVDFYSRYTEDREIARVILEESIEQGIPVNIAFALAWRESQFNSCAVSPPNKGGSKDWGLFQLNDGHRQSWSRAEFFDIRKNTHSALAFLKYCMKEMGDMRLALAAYNRGIWGVRRGGVPPNTKRYVQSIISYGKKLDLDLTLFRLRYDRGVSITR